jgi:hypothetical protein
LSAGPGSEQVELLAMRRPDRNTLISLWALVAVLVLVLYVVRLADTF